LRDACAGPEVETASTNVLKRSGANRQNPPKMSPNQGPGFEGPDPEAGDQIPSRRQGVGHPCALCG
jgi:hypothetical protein